MYDLIHRFLRGTCKKTDGTCPFSHKVSKEKVGHHCVHYRHLQIILFLRSIKLWFLSSIFWICGLTGAVCAKLSKTINTEGLSSCRNQDTYVSELELRSLHARLSGVNLRCYGKCVDSNHRGLWCIMIYLNDWPPRFPCRIFGNRLPWIYKRRDQCCVKYVTSEHSVNLNVPYMT